MEYWDCTVARFRTLAFICRYGHQDIYRLLGRDPMKRPLRPVELDIFGKCLADLWNNEASPRKDLGIPED